MSRTPVRESFLQLAQEELLEIYPQSGTIVSRIDLDHVEEGRFVREMIERAIVREACEQFPEEALFQLESNLAMQSLCVEKGNHQRLFELDEEFHRTLFDGCGKRRAWAMVRQLNCHFDRIRMLRLAANTNWDVVISQHKEIFELILNKVPEKAEKVMMNHLKLVIVEKEELLIRYPDFFK